MWNQSRLLRYGHCFESIHNDGLSKYECKGEKDLNASFYMLSLLQYWNSKWIFFAFAFQVFPGFISGGFTFTSGVYWKTETDDCALIPSFTEFVATSCKAFFRINYVVAENRFQHFTSPLLHFINF